MIKILNVVGARPNFMKMAPIIAIMNSYPEHIIHKLVHTGQHYDEKMSKAFFDALKIPKPDLELGVGSGSHATQTAQVMVEFEKICIREQPDLVVVVGDVNSTLACTITAKKLNIKVAHVEAGLRSRDMEMPEEINRLCTDVLCDFLFTTDRLASKNLKNEGIDPKKIFFVGNVMIDTLVKHRQIAEGLDLIKDLGLRSKEYAILTMHRPSNVDNCEILKGIFQALSSLSQNIPIIFPIHPRTKKMVIRCGLAHHLSGGKGINGNGIWEMEPLGYLEFLHLNMHAKLVLTDSGGLQEETTVLGVPCLTLRENTERPITCYMGTNQIVGNHPEEIMKAAMKILHGSKKPCKTPEKWDGKAAERIVEILVRECKKDIALPKKHHFISNGIQDSLGPSAKN